MDFVWRSIICRYGIPNSLIIDNGKQFNNGRFRQFCLNLGISLKFASPAHPQFNGQVEAVNKMVKQMLKKRLGNHKGLWVDELPGVLWAYWTTSGTATGETSFLLAFGHEAVIPVEIGMPTFQIANFQKEVNDEALKVDLDLLEEKREAAILWEAEYK